MQKIEKISQRKERIKKLVAKLKRMYPKPKSELKYETNFQFVVAVILSAQCTDARVNGCTNILFKTYKTPKDFAEARLEKLRIEISSVPFFRNKAKNIITAARVVQEDFNGNVPRTIEELTTLPGVAYKTANVVLGELYGIWAGIATDTHVRRFALRFDLTDNTDPTKISKDLEALTPKRDWKYVNNGFVLYGRYICPARQHACDEHPLTRIWPPSGSRWPKAK
ncbi:endonuclease III [bacterium]|nr:endonuclease III [bacterium]